jgi:hypothetical protein
VVGRFYEEKTMSKRHHTKFIHVGQYVAEVDLDLIDADEGWSPYISLDDARKLDDIRDALKRGDTKSALQHARVYTLTAVAI